jgi:malate dehydrogenase (quinone)
MAKKYEVAIIGGGITGASILYVLSNYTNVEKIALIEKYKEAAQVNSNRKNNSQTLHFGDIETNYTLEKAKKVKKAAEMVARYLEKNAKHAFRKMPKMVLAVGDKEIEELERRFEEFKTLFPKLKKIDKNEIAKIEPKVVEGRKPDEKIIALYDECGYAVDFGELASSFIENSLKTGKNIEIMFNTTVKEIIKAGKEYVIKTDKGMLEARTVVVAAGSHSLGFAYSMGYGKNWILLPVAGSFFCSSEKMLNGKVYMMQIKKLPFAAIHGDPDVKNPEQTFFGPTAKVLPMLERYNYRSVFDFFRLFEFRFDAIMALLKILSDWTIFKYVLKNIIYDLPFVGRLAFLREVRKIVPSAKFSQIKHGKGVGGIRPQIVDVKEKRLEFGEAKIFGDGIIFNITPSPGASVCLKNAEEDVRKILEFLGEGFNFEEEKFRNDFLN